MATRRPKALIIDGRKVCSDCGELKFLGEFGFHATGAGQRRPYCNPCSVARTRQWDKRNPEKRKAHKRKSWARHRERLNAERRAQRDESILERERRWRAANADKLSEQFRAYRAAHPEKVREWNQRCAERAKAWKRAKYAEDPAPFLARNHIRRAEVGAYGDELAEAIRDIRKQPCTYCGATEDIEIDHVIPLSRGGTNDLENLTPACRRCNRQKWNRTPDEWLEEVA